MSFLKTNDVIKLLKTSTNKDLHEIIDEIVSYPTDKVHLAANTCFSYDGTLDSFKSVVSSIGIENKALKSRELEWIRLVLKNVEEYFSDYDLNALRGIVIVKNEIIICLIKNTTNENAENIRYMRIAYESIRAVVTDSEKCISNVKQELSSKYFPSLDNIKYLTLGILIGIVGYNYYRKEQI